MNRFQQMLVRAQFATIAFIAGVLPAPEDRENGQSSAEYAGIVVVAVTLVVLLIAGAKVWGPDIVALIGAQITKLGAAG